MPQDYATVFTNAKAGMAGVDKEHVKRVVYEMSKDSPHFKNEQVGSLLPQLQRAYALCELRIHHTEKLTEPNMHTA